MQIYTSSWFQYRGEGRIGISRGVPRFNVGKGYRLYKKLAPTMDILKNTAGLHDYEPRFYAEVLDLLDPQEVVDDLVRLAGDHPPVLLCFEKPPFTATNFCHRHMVADWITAHTGIAVTEWSGVQDSNPKQAKLDV